MISQKIVASFQGRVSSHFHPLEGLTRLISNTWPASMSKDESILYDDEIRWKIVHLSLFTMDTLDIADPCSLFMCHI